MTSSHRRRIISFLLLGPSIITRDPLLGAPFFELCGNPLPSSSKIAGEGSGVEVPESGSFRPLNPLCKRCLGAGRPLRKCSSSASVPLQLLEVCSLERVGNAVSDKSLPCWAKDDDDGGLKANLSEVW